METVHACCFNDAYKSQTYMDKESVRKWIQDIAHLFPEYIADKIIETDCPGFTDACLYASNSNNGDH